MRLKFKKIAAAFFAFLLVFPILVPMRVRAVSEKPSVSASSAVLIDADGGSVLYQKNASERRPMASTTKIMTGIIAVESGDLDRTVTVAKAAVGVEGSSVYLFENEKLSMRSLIYALMLESANDAATAIAIEISGSVEAFAEKMNAKASELGLENTSFANPHGLDDPKHYTTASDLAKIAAYAMRNDTFREIVSTYKKVISLNGSDGARLLLNHNRMLHSYEGAIGVKTGYTKKSGRCLVTCAERDGLRLIAVTLNAPDDWKDHTAMLDYGFDNFENVRLAGAGELAFTLPVVGGESSTVLCTNGDDVYVLLPKDHAAPEVITELPRFRFAKVERGRTVGRVIWKLDGHEIARCDVTATHDVEKRKEKRGFIEWIKSLFS